MNKRDLDEAIAEFREAIRLAPQCSGAYNNLGVALGQKKDSTGAIAALREAIRLDPNSDAPHNNLGIVFQATGQLDAAIAEFREGKTSIPEALDRLIALYTATNKPDEVKKYRDLRAKYASPKEGGPMPKESKK